jgi:hypothetical protein
MNGKKVFRRFSFLVHGAVWQFALVSIVTVALLNGVISMGGGSLLA